MQLQAAAQQQLAVSAALHRGVNVSAGVHVAAWTGGSAATQLQAAASQQQLCFKHSLHLGVKVGAAVHCGIPAGHAVESSPGIGTPGGGTPQRAPWNPSMQAQVKPVARAAVSASVN
jgi:hypothetical protein